jgi:hypothetical protein
VKAVVWLGYVAEGRDDTVVRFVREDGADEVRD